MPPLVAEGSSCPRGTAGFTVVQELRSSAADHGESRQIAGRNGYMKPMNSNERHTIAGKTNGDNRSLPFRCR